MSVMIWYTDRLKQPLWNVTTSLLSVSRERDPSLKAVKSQVGQVQNSLPAGSQSPVSSKLSVILFHIQIDFLLI